MWKVPLKLTSTSGKKRPQNKCLLNLKDSYRQHIYLKMGRRLGKHFNRRVRVSNSFSVEASDWSVAASSK